IKNFDPKELCFYTRIYDQGKKSVISVRVSEIYGVPEEQVLLGYGGEEILKNAIHYFLTVGDNKTILIPEFSWWYYNRVAGECGGHFEMYPLYETGDTFAYNVDEVIEYTNRIHPRMLLLASPNNPTGNSLTSEEIGRIMENIPSDTMVLVDEAYASFITSDTDYIAPLVNKYSNLIISRTLSKFYGLPGLRTGFGFIGKGHDQFLSYSNKYLGFNRFAEAVALAALESDEHYRRVADEMEWDRQLFKKELGDLPGFKVYKSVANFILIKYPVEIKEALQKALADQDYKIKFMADKGLESCLRITLGRKEQIQVVVDTIKSVFLNK
ncbi:MAG: histidinol-phosphate aminotransferase family protein, partial [Bacteroidaceae bacterium]|nr:histidinol-phosphate aminotransferase family protein [Bacteroidaceae bacterium]